MVAPSAVCTVNGTPLATSGTSGINVSPGSTITIALVSRAGVNTWDVNCTMSDGLNPNSAFATIQTTKFLNQTNFTCTFVMPALYTVPGGWRIGGSLQFVSVVNAGQFNQNTFNFGVFILGDSMLRLVFDGENLETDATYGVAPDLNKALQGLPLVGPTDPANGDLGGFYPGPYVRSISGYTPGSTVSIKTQNLSWAFDQGAPTITQDPYPNNPLYQFSTGHSMVIKAMDGGYPDGGGGLIRLLGGNANLSSGQGGGHVYVAGGRGTDSNHDGYVHVGTYSRDILLAGTSGLLFETPTVWFDTYTLQNTDPSSTNYFIGGGGGSHINVPGLVIGAPYGLSHGGDLHLTGGASVDTSSHGDVYIETQGEFAPGLTQLMKLSHTGVVTIPNLNTTGIVHNDSSGNLSTSLIVNADITTGTINPGKLSPGTAGQLLMSNNTPVAAWITSSQDVTYAGTGAATVIGLQGRAVYSGAPSNNYVLTWITANNRWEPAAQGAGSGVTWANDLAGSSDTHQYVGAISGVGGAGGVVPLNINTLQFASGQSNPTLSQNSVGSGSGQPMTISAQGVTAGGGVGGNLVLQSGFSTGGTPGNISFNCGALSELVLTDGYLAWASTVANPYFTQTITSTGNGQPFTIKAQDASGASHNGGNLILASGSSASATSGNIQLQIDTTLQLTLTAGQLQWAVGVTNPVINQADISSASANNLTIKAQSATGTSHNGGDLILSSGNSGSATIGAIRLRVGTTFDQMVISAGGGIVCNNSVFIPSLSVAGVVHNAASGLLSTSLIVNADVDAAAAIAGTKINPAFGSQNISTTGTLTAGASTLGSSAAVNSITGSLAYTTRTVTSNLTIDTTTTDYEIFADTSGGAFNITLPTPTNGRWIVIKDKKQTFATNNLTIVRHGTEKIDGVAASLVLSTNNQEIQLSSDGTDWYTQGSPPATAVTTVGTFDSQTSSANGLVISGVNIYAQSATSSNPGMIKLTGDLGNTASSPQVVGLRGKALAAGVGTPGAAQDGYVITWVNANNDYELKQSSGGGGGSVTWAGDLAGSTSSSQKVVVLQNLTVSGAKTANYTATATDYVILIGTLTSSITITLPSSPTTGQSYIIKNTNNMQFIRNASGTITTVGYTVTVSPSSGNIDGISSYVINQPYQSLHVVYSGSEWSIL